MKIVTLFPLLALAGASSIGFPPPARAGDVPDPSLCFDSALPFPPSPFQPDLTPGYVLIEGDIQIPVQHYNNLINGEPQAEATFGSARYWSANTVPYDFVTSGSGAVSSANQTAAINAMSAIATRAGVTFRAATALDLNRIRFQQSSFNNSPVGVRGGAQIINISSWGNSIIICHEIYHSLGFWHEQSRADRETYITINSSSICGTASSGPCAPSSCQGCQDSSGTFISCLFNFNIEAGTSTYGPYDFDSFMHYGRNDFSCNQADTILVKEPWRAQWQGAIGQRTHFSYFDSITGRAIYPFPDDRWLDRAFLDDMNSGAFETPYNDSRLADALENVPSGGTLFIKYANSYNAVGTFSKPVTIMAPNGGVILGTITIP